MKIIHGGAFFTSPRSPTPRAMPGSQESVNKHYVILILLIGHCIGYYTVPHKWAMIAGGIASEMLPFVPESDDG